MARRDLYQVLGVPRGADAEAIRKAYRKLARELHPDLNPQDEQAEDRFKEVSEAYAVLSDKDKRALYDEFGPISLEAGFDAEAARAAKRFGGSFHGFEHPGAGGEGVAFDLDDLLGGLFGGGARGRGRARRGPRASRGDDLEATLELDFLEAARGATKQLQVSRPGPDGRPELDRVTVRIPAGVDDGGRIRIPGKGGAGRGGGSPGDLWARIRVRPHPVFRREGRDLFLDLPVSISEATLGARVEIPTLEGTALVTVPPGSDSGRRLRLRGKGVPDPRTKTRGDLYATVQIRVPVALDSDAQAKLLELRPFDPPGIRKEFQS